MNPRTIVKKLIPRSLFPAIEPYGHLVEAVLLNTLNGFPAKNFKIIGVTGTNGKTSTSFLIHKMLQTSGYKVGLMSTIGYGAGDRIIPQIHHMTNVAVPELMSRLKWMKEQGVEWLVLETTSHALAQNRVWGVPYSIAVMTNVTHEHLDWHKTFKNYLNAKRKLFTLTNKNKKGMRLGVINAEDPSANLFARDIKNALTYGIKRGDIKAEHVQSTASGNTCVVRYQQNTLNIRCNLPGKFNVYNVLAAVGVGLKIGLSNEQIEQGIAALKSVEGRMTPIDEGQDYHVIVDFAHNPDGFEKVLSDIKPVVKGKLIVMFGSAGRRDEAKRPIQGEIAGKYADEVVLTEEDDRDVDGMQILNEIATGSKKAGKTEGKDLFLVHNRPEAIEFTLKRAKKGDTVLLLGKGHEKTMESADGEHPWNEIEITHKTLKRLTSSGL